MSKFNYLYFLLLVCLMACGKETNNLQTNAASAYYPLSVGQIFHYQLDSIVFENFGQQRVVRSYDAMDEVIQESIDQNDTSYYVTRKIKPIGSDVWSNNISYTVLKKKNQVQVVEENLRYIKLMDPVTPLFQWTGNSYLPYRPFRIFYEFSNDEDIQYWNYEYASVNEDVSILDVHFSNTITVVQAADSVNVPITITNGIAYKNHWEETYALGIGLIEKKVELWEYQPPIGSQQSYRSGFGIHLRLKEIEF